MLPVADVDRAKAFYVGLGWRLDADLTIDEHYRVVQVTPPGSPASIIFGKGTTTMAPGSVQDLMLIVEDIDAARNELIAHGADVSEVWHDETGSPQPTEGRAPDPTRRATPTAAGRRSRIRTATAGCSGNQRAASRPGVSDGRRGPRRAAARDGRASRRVRGGRPAARLVGLVRGLHGRSRARNHAGGASAAAGRYMAEVKHVVIPA